jgi:hypothetical protein
VINNNNHFLGVGMEFIQGMQEEITAQTWISM